MRNKDSLPELLCPCGSYETLKAAVAGGADAVYIGGTLFNARMNAKNFDRDRIVNAVKECHKSGVRLYVTVNTQIYDKELKLALEYVGFLYESGVDAIIIADLGLAELVKKYYPKLELHASTQMTAHNLEAVNRLFSIGYKRVVIARETSMENLMTICQGTEAEVEMFVHGAICVCTSGQCLMSSMLGGRSGNRGECAQPCRMKYDGAYPISLKDMCLAGHIPEIIKSGVASLKIEGRMKSPSYVFGVTRIYRRLLDEKRAATEKEIAELSALFSRGGFTDGYFTGKINNSMLGVRSEKDKADSRTAQLKIVMPEKPRLCPIETVCGEHVELPSRLFNPQRRPAKKIIESARFNKAAQIPDSVDYAHIYLPLSGYEAIADGVTLPPVVFDSELYNVEKKLEKAVSKGAKRALVCNIGQISLAEKFGLAVTVDYRMNIFNTASANAAASLFSSAPESVLLSAELTLPQIRDIYFNSKVLKGAIVYGRIPLMLVEKPIGRTELRDTKNARFPVMRENGRDMILNSVPTYMAEYTSRLDEAGIEERHFLFTTESRAEVMKVIYAYKHKQPSKEPIRRIK